MPPPIAFTNYDKLGTFEPWPHPITSQVNKRYTTSTTATTYEIYIGALIAHQPGVATSAEFEIAKSTSERPFEMAFGYSLKSIAGQNYLLIDSQFTAVAALNNEKQVPALAFGIATMAIDGIVYPDQYVMPADGTTSHGGTVSVLGHVQAWDGTNRKTIAGQYRGLIGQSGGKFTKTPTLDLTGQLGKVFLNGPGAQ